MSAPNIVAIAPNRELEHVLKDLVKENSLPVRVYQGDLLEGLEVARAALEDKVEVFVSRGGTALMLQHADMGVPVVEIKVSAYDILTALAESRRVTEHVAVVGFKNVIQGSAEIARLIDLQADEYHVDSALDVTDCLRHVKELGIKWVIGDTVVHRSAASLGLGCTLITSGKKAVLEALETATFLASVRRRERANAIRLQTILDHVGDGVVAVDKDGNIVAMNKTAEQVLSLEDMPKLNLRQTLSKKEATLNEIITVAKHVLLMNRLLIQDDGIVMGAVATFKDVSDVESAERKVRRALVTKGHRANYTFTDIMGTSPALKAAIKEAKSFAFTDDTTVLIVGPTGSGKELFAQSIHNASARREGPFVAVNCAALPASLLESELFGYVGGAFTGAKRKGKAGLFELAHTGTIFLDEIGEMPLELQARLLRVLEEREVVRLGSERVTPVNIRVIAATNRDLKEAVDKGKFRADLYYRLNVLPLRVPSLDERRSDIPLLFRYFVAKIAEHLGQETPVISAPALELICSRSYPGNVRELKNLAERLTVLARDGVISPASVGQMPIKEERHEIENTPQQPKCKGGDVIEVPVNTLKKMESRMVQEVLKKFHGDRQKTANVLGVSRTTVWRKVRQANGG